MKTLKNILEGILAGQENTLHHGDKVVDAILVNKGIEHIVASKDKSEFKKNIEDTVKHLRKVNIKDITEDGIYVIVSKFEIDLTSRSINISKNILPCMFTLVLSNQSYCFFNMFRANKLRAELYGPNAYSFGL